MSTDLPIHSASSDLFDTPAFAALTLDQRRILRLYFLEGWTLARIPQLLRCSLRTVRRHKADALAALQASAQEVAAAVERQEGRVRCRITFRQNGKVETRTDTTLSAVMKRF